MALTKDQVARYSRQLILPEVGVRGQERLLASSILIVGAGGLGSPAALYLAAAGIGRLEIMDDDAVAPGNLPRQLLHGYQDVGHPKASSAKARLEVVNPDVAIDARQERLTAANAPAAVARHDLVLDGSDNFPTRYLVNDACVLAGKPLVHGGVVQLQGQVLTVLPRQSACVRCVFPEPPLPGDAPNCQEAGVMGTAAGIVGTVMAHEALKVLLGIGQPLADRLLVFEGRASRFREVPVRRNPRCAVCGEAPTIRELVAEEVEVCMSRQKSESRTQSSLTSDI